MAGTVLVVADAVVLPDRLPPTALTPAPVTVIVPAFDAAGHIGSTLDALRAQSVQPAEVIVVDDGSSDETAAVVACHPIAATLVRQRNVGPAAARHTGAIVATQPWLLFVDSDDTPDSTWVQRLVEVAGDAALVCCGTTWPAAPAPRLPEPLGVSNHGIRGLFLAGTFMVRADVYHESGGYDTSLRFGESTELGWRICDVIANRGLAIAEVREPLVTLRGRPGSRSADPRHTLAASEHILANHGHRLADDPALLADHLAIRSVSARRLGNRRVAITSMLSSIRVAPWRPRRWGGLAKAFLTRPAPNPVVLHVIAHDIYRGGQSTARALVVALGGAASGHRTLTIFDHGPGLFRPDIALGVPSGRWRRAGLDLRAVRMLRRAVRNLAPSAVVAHGGEALKYLSVAGPHRVPVAYHKIGTIATDFGWQQRVSHAFGLRRAHTVVAVSDDARREVMALGRNDAISIPNGRDEQRWRPRARAQPPLVMFVGAMTDGKRPHVFIDVVRALRAADVECRAAMIGDGPLDLRAAAESAQIRWWGARDDVPDLLGTADVLVFTSLPAGEGLPGVLVEAGMCEVACVAAEVPGTNQAIVDGVTGIIVGNGPAEDVARRITATLTELLTDTDRLRAMQRAARSHCVAQFSISEYRRRWATVIDEMRR